jgi:hypothetical protein
MNWRDYDDDPGNPANREPSLPPSEGVPTPKDNEEF